MSHVRRGRSSRRFRPLGAVFCLSALGGGAGPAALTSALLFLLLLLVVKLGLDYPVPAGDGSGWKK